MWIYSQSTGRLWNPERRLEAVGYSGAGEDKNKPESEHLAYRGPIPRGFWTIGKPYDSKMVGPFALPLTPVGHNAHGRTAFLFHGDSIKAAGTASRGCIIFSRAVRGKIHYSGDLDLLVIE
jgi:hypothetical protein